MTTKHTPSLTVDSTCTRVIDATERKQYVVAEVHGSTVKEIEANTRLFSAAPELLQACEEVLAWASTPGDHCGNPYCKRFVQLAQAAIAKATK